MLLYSLKIQYHWKNIQNTLLTNNLTVLYGLPAGLTNTTGKATQ